ncbi:MAG: hypothetical protein ABSC10_07210 [Candidatus Acidiferrales bacterium]|jgi:hypothetical protein
MTRSSLTFFATAILLLYGGPPALAQNNPAATKGKQATPDPTVALPHDHHDGLTVTADPYVDKARGKEKFGKANPLDAGILPVEIFMHNETNDPIRVDINTIQLEVQLRKGNRQELDWLAPEDVAGLVAHPGGVTPSNRPRIAGIPLPSGDKKTDKLAEILRPLTLDADVVPPMGALHGFLYFNVNYEMSLADTAVLYVPDASIIASKKALMFYEVRFGKPAQAPANPSQ